MALAIGNKDIDVKRFEKQKNTLVKKVLSTKDADIILLLSSYFQDLTSAKRISKAQYNKEIEEAERRVKAGKFVTNKQVMEEMKKW
jgi:hypothetical protein